MRTLAILSILLLTSQAFSQSFDPQSGCQLKGDEIVSTANQILQDNNKKFPPSYEFERDADGDISFDGQSKQDYKVGFEGYFRPERPTDYELIKDIIALDLDPDHDVIYVCASADSAQEKLSHLSIYFLRGNRLSGRNSITGWIESFIFGQQLKVSAATLDFAGILKLPRIFRTIFRRLPGVNLIYSLIKTLVFDPASEIFKNTLDIVGQNVERAVITEDGVEIAAVADPKDPSKGSITKYIKFESKTKFNIPQAPSAPAITK